MVILPFEEAIRICKSTNIQDQMKMKGYLGQKKSLAKNAESALYGRLFEIFKDIGRDLSP
jgi:hypothetical protein